MPDLVHGLLRLNLAGNRLTPSRVKDLLDKLPRDKVVDLQANQNDLGDAAPRTLLQLLPNLRRLGLSAIGLGPDGVRNLVTELFERHVQEGAEDIHCVLNNSSSSCSLDLVADADDPRLRILDLSANSLEGGVTELGSYLASRSCTLTSLDLSYNAFSPNAVRDLAQRLLLNSTLRSLRLAHCHLKEEGATLLELIGDEESRMPLRCLDLARNGLTENAWKVLAFFLGGSVGRGLTDLDVSGNSLAEEPHTRALGRGLSGVNEKVELLSVADVDAVNGGAVDVVDRSTAGYNKLRIHISNTKLYYDPHRGSDVLTAIRVSGSRVCELVFDHCSLSEKAIPTLARAVVHLRFMSFSHNQLGEAFARALADISRCLLQRNQQNKTRATGAAPQTRVRLRQLRMNECLLGDRGAVFLGEALEQFLEHQSSIELKVLELRGNHLSVDAVDSLGPVISQNVNLERLVLSGNRLKFAGACRLSEWLPLRSACKPLALEVKKCNLTAEGALQVWHGCLLEGAQIKALELADNAIDDECIDAMRAACPSSCRASSVLREISLTPNPCSSSAIVRFASHCAPWCKLALCESSLDGSDVAQLLDSLGWGSGWEQTEQTGSASQDFSLALSRSTLLSRQWHWSALASSIQSALAPSRTHRERFSAFDRWQRFGGCGGTIFLALDHCDLCRANFKEPSCINVPTTVNQVRPPSLARSARKEIRARKEKCNGEVEAWQKKESQSLAARARGITSGAQLGGKVSKVSMPNGMADRIFAEAADSSSSRKRKEEDELVGVPGRSASVERRWHHTEQRPCSAERHETSNTRSHSAEALGWKYPGYPGVSGRLDSGPPLGWRSPTRALSRSKSRFDGTVPSSHKANGDKSVPMAVPCDLDRTPNVQAGENCGRTCDRSGLVNIDVSVILRELRGIETLKLVGCRLTDGWIVQLCQSGGRTKWSGVRFLDLSNNTLTVRCISAVSLVASHGLEALIIDKNRLTAEGLKVLCCSIKGNRKCCLRRLSVADNQIGHPGGFVVADLLLSPGCTLQKLSLARNPQLSSGELIAVSRALCRQTQDKQNVDPAGPGQLLEELDISGCGADTPIIPYLTRSLGVCAKLVVDIRDSPAGIKGSQVEAAAPELLALVKEGRLLL